MGYPDHELSILIVDDKEIARMNEHYLHHKGPTNVISFSMQEGDFADVNPLLLGDVVISADTAQREAREARMPFAARFAQLLVHGILHLVGYDHEASAQEAESMEAKSEEMLAMLARMEPVT
ncbi:rRNA maturation RNase YbeY [Desulfatirhabdium butyrativorans]|uniref:rRNA maturation RNase YbeY n=1 Tax=Desulfatirhabdium butyrativorans TaxID=340467 RepID=UPI0004170FC7|nr:rRNA maturation RNase YbeY [Desulfatirhabdium butyrativorans]